MDRNPCFCSLRDKDPNYYSKQGIPDGFCSLCNICKKPGHACHVPAPLPYTGGWCDEHFQLIKDAFSPNFTDNKIKLYFKSLASFPEKSKTKGAYYEFIGDMPFRFVIKEEDKFVRYKHGDVRVQVSSWLVPLYAWGDSLEEIKEIEFTKFWEDAVNPISN